MTLTLSPNPCDTGTYISFNVLGNDTVTMDCITTFGNIQTSFLPTTILSSGQYTAYFNTKLLQNGIYFIRIKRNSSTSASKLLVVHGIVSSVLKISEDAELFIFPNPVNDFLKLNLIEDYDIEIFNELAQLSVKSKIVDGVIDIEKIISGKYFCKIYNSNHQFVKQFSFIKN